MKQLVSGFLVLLFCGVSFASSEVSIKEIVVALKPDKNPDKMQSEKIKLESYLSKKVGLPVRVIIPISGAVIQQSLANGSVDLAYLSGMDMLQAESKQSAEVLLVGEKAGKSSYESVWLVKKDSPYKSVSDLKNKPIAFASLTSTSGYLTPYAHLIKAGLLQKEQNPEAFFGKNNVYYGSGYTSAIQRIFEGNAEAAAVSDYVFLEDKHLTAEEKSKLRILQKQGPVPTHIIAIRKTISDNQKKLLKKALLDLNQENPELRDQVFTSKLVESTSEKHLSSLKEFTDLTGFLKNKN